MSTAGPGPGCHGDCLDCGGPVTALDKVGRLFLIDPSNHNLSKPECGDFTFSSFSFNPGCRDGGPASQGKAAPSGGEGPAQHRGCTGQAGLAGGPPCAPGWGRNGVGPAWGLQGRGQNGPSHPLRGWFLYCPPSLPHPAAPAPCQCRAEPFRAP